MPAPGGYRWVVLGVGMAAQAAISAVQLGLPAIAPALRERYALTLVGRRAAARSASGASVTPALAGRKPLLTLRWRSRDAAASSIVPTFHDDPQEQGDDRSGADRTGVRRGVLQETTRRQWQEAAEAWHRWGPVLEGWLGEATETMLEMAGIRPGDRVLDVAAGAGGQTLAAARRVGPEGHVLATDISSRILEFAELEAQQAGLANVRTRVLDGERLDLEEGTFDAVISRVGFIYFPDQQAALRGMHRALRPGGRLAGVVYSTPQMNEFFSIPVGVIRRRAQLPAPAPGQPGPFSFGQHGVIESAFEKAGFENIATVRLDAPLCLAAAAECVAFERESFGALHQMLAGLDESGREAAWQEIEQELRRFEGPTGFAGPCELIVAAGTKPL